MKRVLVIICIGFMGYYSYAQSVVSSVIATAGKSETVGNLQISWTLGEIAIETLDDNSSVILAQGFQQGDYEITSIEGVDLSDSYIKAYPNPVKDYVMVAYENEGELQAIIELFDMNGKLLYSKRINDFKEPEMIRINQYSSSSYILRVSDYAGKVLRTFKLIKR